jgi:hypothetical protein
MSNRNLPSFLGNWISFCFEKQQHGDRLNKHYLENLPETTIIRDQIILITEKGKGLFVKNHAVIDGNRRIGATQPRLHAE